jgi:HEAT repeat protein
MSTDGRVALGRVFAVGLLLSSAAAARPDDDPCRSLWAGNRDQADPCAKATLAHLTRDNYSLSVSDLDGIGEPAVPALAAALSSEEWLKRAGAADALGRIGVRLEKPASILDTVASHAEDANEEVRRQVIGAIARIGLRTQAAEQAARKAELDSDAVVRGLAGHALKRMDASDTLKKKRSEQR